MPIGTTLLKELQKKYMPSTLIEMRWGRQDVAFRTDKDGHPILLFIGKKDMKGAVIGQRYARTLLFDRNGNKIKDHWDLKGLAT